MTRAVVIASVLAVSAARAAADAPATHDTGAEAALAAPSTTRRLAAIGAAIVPGVIVRGAGSWVVGEKRAAGRLAATAAIGLGAIVAGGTAVGISGGSPYTLVGIPLVVLGTGLVLPTWFSDVWVAAGGGAIGRTRRAPAPWTLEAGSVYLRDPFRHRALVHAAARVERGRLGVGASALRDAAGDATTGDVEVRWRLAGAAAHGGVIADGSRLGVRAAGRLHRDDADDVTLATAELELYGRLVLDHLHPALGGTFVELATGAGVERATYAMDAHDVDGIMLGRFAWGAYVGASELSAFYDHRRDHLAGGFPAGRAAGFVGSFGAIADVRLGGPWALHGAVEVGNAWVTTLAVRYQGGAR